MSDWWDALYTETALGRYFRRESQINADVGGDAAIYAYEEGRRAAGLEATLRAAQGELETMKVALEALAGLLTAMGVDDATMRARVEEALRDRERELRLEGRAFGPDGGPFRSGGAPVPAEPGATERCAACQRTVARSLTVFTEKGLVCDVCHARMPGG